MMDINQVVLRERIEWVDIAKGIGIILVILGHTISINTIFPVYAFHMPLFFFLSGILYYNNSLSFYDYVKDKLKSIIRPWAIIWFISLVVCLLIPFWRHNLSITPLIYDLYTANSDTIQNSSIWYLVCFFIVTIYFYPIKKMCNRLIINVVLVILCTFSFLLPSFLSWFSETIISLPDNRFPFKADSAIIGLFFYAFAAFNKDSLITSIVKCCHSGILYPLFVITILLCVYNGFANMNSLIYGNYFLLYYPIAIISIITICSLSVRLERSSLFWLKELFVFYGKNSLIIFGFQSLFIRFYYLCMNKFFGLNLQLYIDNPVVHQCLSFCFVTFVMTPVFVLFVKKSIVK